MTYVEYTKITKIKIHEFQEILHFQPQNQHRRVPRRTFPPIPQPQPSTLAGQKLEQLRISVEGESQSALK